MPIAIIVPRLGWSMEEGAFVAWLKKDGEFVQAGDPLFSIEGDKAIQEVEAIDSGVLRIAPNGPKAGSAVRVGDVLGHLCVKGAEISAAPPTILSGPPTPALEPAETAAAVAQEKKVESSGPAHGRKQSVISPRARRVAGELGIDWRTIAGSGRGGRIRERDVRSALPVPHLPIAGVAIREASTVLVTGGCGFIGTWVIRQLLEQGLGVVVLDMDAAPPRWERVIGPRSRQVPLVRGSLMEVDLLGRIFQDHAVTHVIHLAALLTPACQADPWEGARVNILGGLALLERIRRSGGRVRGLAYASSVAVFGDEAGAAAGNGGDPVTFYGAFKKSLELIAAQYWRHFQIPSVGIRPQVAYGPERDVGMTAGVSLAARAAACGEPFSITYTGTVGYDYVEDVARAFIRCALETPPGAQVVDLPGETADIEDVIQAIVSAAPDAARLTASGPPIPAYMASNRRFISSLYPDWKTTSLKEGMARTVGFYRRGSGSVVQDERILEKG